MNGKHYIGKRVSSFEAYNDVGPITGIALVVDSNNEYLAGDQNGYVLEIECPYGTQAMADNILAGVSGRVYHGYRAENAILTPTAELGDGATVNGVYSMLAYRKVKFGPGHMSEIAAPGENDVDHEYPYVSSTQREINRQVAQTRSSITKTAEQIRLEITNEVEGLSSSINMALDSITARVTGLEGSYSSIEQYVDSLTLSVSNDSTSSTIKLMAGSAEIASQEISMSGLVTYTGLASGTTVINGGCIQTGTIDAEYLNLTGAIKWTSLSSGMQSIVDDIESTADSAYNMADSAYDMALDAGDIVSGWSYTYGGTTYIDGTMLMTGTVTASTIQGGEVLLLDDGERTAGSLTLTGASSYSGRKLVIDSGAIEINAAYGDVYIESGSGAYLQLKPTGLICNDDFMSSNISSLGTSTYPWSAVYAQTGAVSTSDRNRKHDIEPLPEKYLDMLLELPTYRFRLNGGTSDRFHVGYIAQDVEEAMGQVGIDSLEFAGFVKDVDADGNELYMLRYDEFMAIHTLAIQKIYQRLEAAGL